MCLWSSTSPGHCGRTLIAQKFVCACVCVCVSAGARVLHVGTTHSGTFSSRRTDSLLRLLRRRALTWLYLVVNPDKQIFAFGNMRMLVVESCNMYTAASMVETSRKDTLIGD